MRLVPTSRPSASRVTCSSSYPHRSSLSERFQCPYNGVAEWRDSAGFKALCRRRFGDLQFREVESASACPSCAGAVVAETKTYRLASGIRPLSGKPTPAKKLASPISVLSDQHIARIHRYLGVRHTIFGRDSIARTEHLRQHFGRRDLRLSHLIDRHIWPSKETRKNCRSS